MERCAELPPKKLRYLYINIFKVPICGVQEVQVCPRNADRHVRYFSLGTRTTSRRCAVRSGGMGCVKKKKISERTNKKTKIWICADGKRNKTMLTDCLTLFNLDLV